MGTTTNSQSLRVLGVVGSPRRNSNTEILVDAVLQGAQAQGASTEKVLLKDRNISPCQACEYCFTAGYCKQHDDMPALLEAMQQSDLWVLGTPLYWSGPSAQFKLFLDRWFGQSQVVKFEGRRIILVIPLGDQRAESAQHLIGMMKQALNHLKANLIETIVVPGVWEAGSSARLPEALESARRAGQHAVM